MSSDITGQNVNSLLSSILKEVKEWADKNNIDLEDPQEIEPVLQGLIVLFTSLVKQSGRNEFELSGEIEGKGKDMITDAYSVDLRIKQLRRIYEN